MELTKAGRDARREYLKEWRRRNPEKVKEYDIRRWNKLAERGGVKPGHDKNKSEKTEE